MESGGITGAENHALSVNLECRKLVQRVWTASHHHEMLLAMLWPISQCFNSISSSWNSLNFSVQYISFCPNVYDNKEMLSCHPLCCTEFGCLKWSELWEYPLDPYVNRLSVWALKGRLFPFFSITENSISDTTYKMGWRTQGCFHCWSSSCVICSHPGNASEVTHSCSFISKKIQMFRPI